MAARNRRINWARWLGAIALALFDFLAPPASAETLTDAMAAEAASLRTSYHDTGLPLEPAPEVVPLATIRATGARYCFDAASTASDDGDAVIAARSSATTFDETGNPTDLGANPGRWLRMWP